MRETQGRTRFWSLAAIGCLLVISGISVRGATGDLDLGAVNDANMAATSLLATTDDDGLVVVQRGTGVAIRGIADAGTASAGAFGSAMGTGLVTKTGNSTSFSLRAANDSEATGAGGAIKADGRYNDAVVADSFGGSAIVATATGSRPAIVADAPSRTAIRATAPGGGDAADCTELFCAGTESTGAIGVIAGTATTDGAGVYAVDQTADGTAFAIVAEGDTILDGGLAVTDGCVGCSSMIMGRNGSDQPIAQGDAVAVIGLDVAPDGSTIVLVGPAPSTHAAVGIADRAIALVTRPARTSSVAGGWQVGLTTTSPAGYLRIATQGILTLDQVVGGMSSGDRLAVGDDPGALAPAAAGEASIGRYLGERPDGKGVLLIDRD